MVLKYVTEKYAIKSLNEYNVDKLSNVGYKTLTLT